MLKIIASSKINKNFIDGILLVLTKIGCECYFWDKTKKPFFDMLDEKKPDILLLMSNEEPALMNGQNESKFKTILFGLNKPQTKYDLWCKPILLENEDLKQEKIFILNEYANTLKYSGDLYESSTHSYDIVYFVEKLLFINNANQIMNMANFVFNNISTFNNVRTGIWGEIPLHFNEYIGQINNKDKRLVMHNSKIGLDFCGENCMDFALFKVPCITLEDRLPIFFSCFTLKDIFDKLNMLYKMTDIERKNYGTLTYDYIFRNELTDYHITSKILKQLGYNDLGEKCLKIM